MSVCPQDNLLWESLTGEEHLCVHAPPPPLRCSASLASCSYFYGRLKNLQGAVLDAAVDDALRSVNLAEPATRQKLSGEYSGGMKRRLSLAIALLHEPEILILDEPTVGIDPLLRRSIWAEFTKLQQQGITIIITTHVMDEAYKCGRLAMIREGQLIAVGTPQELMEKHNTTDLETAFLAYGGVK